MVMLHKTEKGRGELRPGMRTLGQRERSVLLLADGTRSLDELKPLFGGDGQQIVARLLADGYLAPIGRPARERPAPAHPAPAPRVAADAFEGKRSLATTRMFLFDLCERMFARRDPQLAERFRRALRESRDRDAMLAAGREMISEIERVAGPERADSISERVAMLLPPETV